MTGQSKSYNQGILESIVSNNGMAGQSQSYNQGILESIVSNNRLTGPLTEI